MMGVKVRDVAVGFLYHSASGQALLHLRGAEQAPSAGQWAFFGGGSEPEDRGDLRATWCREMREELGVTLEAVQAVSLRHGTYDDGSRWHEFWYPWPTLGDIFALTEGQRYAWFTLDEARGLPDLAAYAREALAVFRQRLMRGHEASECDAP